MRIVLIAAQLSFISTGCFPSRAHPDRRQDALETTAAGAQALTADMRDDNLGMGNPSNALNDGSDPNNYLMVKPPYALSYNSSRGTANWVSWHLSSAWKGNAPRSTSFTADSLLPPAWKLVYTSWYTGTGFDRGHMCPSEDRDASASDNKATFLMTNILPQAPNNNQITWKALEDYARALVSAQNELYIIAGPGGVGGIGSTGSQTTTIHSGNVTVPAYFWKVLVVLPVGSDDVNRVTASTRVIAVKMPNTQSVSNEPWYSYRVSVDSLEALTGYDFLSKVPAGVQSTIEAVVDSIAVP
jgi:endonuclease G